MSNFDEGLYSISVDPTIGYYPEFDNNDNPILPLSNKYELSTEDALCFKCELADCKENSVKCLINIEKLSK